MPTGANLARLVFVALWLATTAYIALLPTRHFSLDAINNLLFTEESNIYELWHPQHLLAQWPGYWLYHALAPLSSGNIRAWQAIQASGAIMGGATVALLFATLYSLIGALRPLASEQNQFGRISHIWPAALGALALWISYGFWHYQSDTDVYSPVYLAVALLMWAYVRYLLVPGLGQAALLGLCASLAFLGHQLNIEIAGLIGLSLVYLSVRAVVDKRDPWRWLHIVAYGLLLVLPPVILYGLGWLNAGAYLVQVGGVWPSFRDWALRYFVSAGEGKATWGNKLSLASLPTAGYTFLASWILPPLVNQISGWQAMLLIVLLVAAGLLFIHMAIVLWRNAPRVVKDYGQWPLILTAVCTLTLAANFVSGWWWAYGNIKFYLPMQIPLIVLVALYLSLVRGTWMRRIARAAVGVAAAALLLFQVLATLPYERQGGVFVVNEMLGDRQVSVWFAQRDYQTMLDLISHRQAIWLQPGFCDAPLVDNSPSVWWVINERETANCPPLANAQRIGQFQADRTRDWFVIYRMK